MTVRNRCADLLIVGRLRPRRELAVDGDDGEREGQEHGGMHSRTISVANVICLSGGRVFMPPDFDDNWSELA